MNIGNNKNKVLVKWWDDYSEEFEATEMRAGAYLLWMRLLAGMERSIPLMQVRWYSRSIENEISITNGSKPTNKVAVRWWDGYLKEFEATDVEADAYLLKIHSTNGREINIPLIQVRWYSRSIESHQDIPVKNIV